MPSLYPQLPDPKEISRLSGCRKIETILGRDRNPESMTNERGLVSTKNRMNALEKWATEGKGKKLSQEMDGLRSQVEILTEDLYQKLDDYYKVLQDDLCYLV